MWRPVIRGNLFPNTNVKSVVQKLFQAVLLVFDL